MRVELKVPNVGESIAEVQIGEWKKAPGQRVEKDEVLVVLESEKATVDFPSPQPGFLVQQLKNKGQTAQIGEVIGYLDESAPEGTAATPTATTNARSDSPQPAQATPAARVMPAAERVMAEHDLRAQDVHASGPGGRLLKEDVLRHLERSTSPAVGPSPENKAAPEPARPASPSASVEVVASAGGNLAPAATPPAAVPKMEASAEEVVAMSRLRRTVAERLVQAQHQAALLTTFNEIDMSQVLGLRKEFGEGFQAKYGTKLGFMSFFIKAAVDALQLVPQVNAEIRGGDIVYYKRCDIGVAIGGGKGLVVPVLRNAERLSFAEIELAIADFAQRAKDSKLKPDELRGGTFTISNGGVYGSLLSTPIVNPPQSGVLGMHAIQERPVAHQGQVVIRPMMYAALTYDHRLVDGREAVTFLKRIKEVVEHPARLLIGA
jgi:2-oxoglutarate dehydrogenase E2 component (dihydrolipoamide succinyltransferase)